VMKHKTGIAWTKRMAESIHEAKDTPRVQRQLMRELLHEIIEAATEDRLTSPRHCIHLVVKTCRDAIRGR